MPTIPPMKAQDLTNEVDLDAEDLGLGQFLSNPDPDRYAIEKKVDGCRIQIRVGSKGNTVLSRGRDVTAHFPHLRDATVEGADGILLDGELLAEGPDGQILSAATSLLVSSAQNAVRKQKEYGAAWVVVFDILDLGTVAPGGVNVMSLPYDDRRVLLEKVVPPLGEAAVFMADYHIGTYSEVSVQLIESEPATVASLKKFRDGEGFMIKDRRGSYRPGGRDGSGWYKFKWLSTFDAVITGYTPGKNSLSGMVGSVQLSLWDTKRSEWLEVASVGVFTNAFRRELTDEDGYLRSDFYGKVMEAACQGMGTGRKARHPRFVRMRPDKDMRDCGLDQLDSIPKV